MVAESGRLRAPLPHTNWDSYGSRPRFDPDLDLGDPALYPLEVSAVELPIIHLRSAVITERKDARVRTEKGKSGELHAALIDREGAWISRAGVGFAANLDGLASTYNTTTHLLVLGRRPESIARAAQRVRELDGGIVVVEGEKVASSSPSPSLA